MKIGLYFGSFNPVHNGHLIIAKHVINNTDLKQVWMVISPQNPLKNSNSLLNKYDRLNLVQSVLYNRHIGLPERETQTTPVFYYNGK